MSDTGKRTSSPDDELYALLDELDRLEELIEDMDALGVATREQAEARMAELDARVEALAPDDPGRD